MSEPPSNRTDARRWIAVVLRLAIGLLFIYMGASKALHPVDFLKLVRQYEMVDAPLLLNLITATLPWFEVFCGILLASGLAVRATALVSFCMLVPFTLLVLRRALAIHAATHAPFCSIRFDCGCGAGEVLICYKMLENSLLIAASGWLAWRRSQPKSAPEPSQPGQPANAAASERTFLNRQR